MIDGESKRRRLHRLQGGICAVCFHRMADYGKGGGGKSHATIEHTWPRSRYKGLRWNSTAAHRRCNDAKSNRDPTGCELIGLAWVQALREADGEKKPRYVARAPIDRRPTARDRWGFEI
jgi:5-methylcytosine-specific restriction endonuclease McrA